MLSPATAHAVAQLSMAASVVPLSQYELRLLGKQKKYSCTLWCLDYKLENACHKGVHCRRAHCEDELRPELQCMAAAELEAAKQKKSENDKKLKKFEEEMKLELQSKEAAELEAFKQKKSENDKNLEKFPSHKFS